MTLLHPDPSTLTREEAAFGSLRRAVLNEAFKLGEGVDKSGKPYAWMVDSREVLLQGKLLRDAAKLLWQRLKPYRPDRVGGMTMAANPLTIAVMIEAELDGYPLDSFLIRREPKVDGLRKLVEGPSLQPGMRVVLLDDLVNSGETQKQALKALQPFDVEVVAVGVLLDCERAGSKWLKSEGIALEALFTMAELGIAMQLPRDPGALALRWCQGPLNTGKYPAPKSRPLFVGDTLYVGSDAGFVAALDLAGAMKWRFQVRDTERGVHSSPAYHDGKVYFGSYDGHVYAVDAATGELAWENRVGQWVGSSPAIDPGRDRLYIGIEYGEAGGSLVALDAHTGEQLWELKASHYIHSSPCYDAARDQVLVGSNDHSLYCADAATGALRWEFHTGGEIKGNPVVDEDGTCFVGAMDGHLYALDAASGHLRWKRRAGRSLYTHPLIHDDLVLFGGSSCRVLACERATGVVRWVATFGDRIVGGAAMMGDRAVVVASTDGVVHMLDVTTGRVLADYKTGGPVMTTPGAGAGLVVVPSFDGGHYAFAPGQDC